MTSPSSLTFKPKLTDQEYMELVFENGQFLAKSQRSNAFSLQNQRTKSIVDLYEDEYNEDFKKSIIHGADEKLQRMVVYYEIRKEIEFIPPDAQSVVAERSVDLGFDSTDFTDGDTYLSSSLDDDPKPRVPAGTRKDLVKRRRSSALYDSPEKKQRNDINKKMRRLRNLLPKSDKDDTESTLDEAINYVRALQYQFQMMTMSNGFVTPAMMLPMGLDYSQMGLLPKWMQMGVPQFLPPPFLGAGLPGITNSADMLWFLDHPGLMPMQNFYPTENYFPQSVPPSCAASPNQIHNSTSLSKLDGARKDGGILTDKKV